MAQALSVVHVLITRLSGDMTSHPTAEDLEIFEAVREQQKNAERLKASVERAGTMAVLDPRRQAEIVGGDLQVRKRRSYNHPGQEARINRRTRDELNLFTLNTRDRPQTARFGAQPAGRL